jgi:hypothetical protein
MSVQLLVETLEQAKLNWMQGEEIKIEFIDTCIDLGKQAIASAEQHEKQSECTRSHPHENMDEMCELRTEIARLTNELVRVKQSDSVTSVSEVEPVAWIEHEWSGSGLRHLHFERREQSLRDEVVNPIWTPLYINPQPKRNVATPREWVNATAWRGLTDEEIEDCYKQGGIGRAIQMLKEKNT